MLWLLPLWRPRGCTDVTIRNHIDALAAAPPGSPEVAQGRGLGMILMLCLLCALAPKVLHRGQDEE